MDSGEQLQLPLWEQRELSDLLKDYFPNSSVQEIKLENVHERALSYFEGMSRRFISPESYKPGNFYSVVLIDTGDGRRTYAVAQDKIHGISRDFERNIFLGDFDEANNYVGHGEVMYFPEGGCIAFYNLPVVGFTSTHKGFTRGGLAKRRLYLMNCLTLAYFNLQLQSSSSFVDPNAGKAWERLVKNGHAIPILVGELKEPRKRFVFLRNSDR